MIWTFCSRRANVRINKLYEQALRLVYDDYKTSLSDFFAKYHLFKVHHTNIQTFLLQLYKIKHNLSECSVKDLFSTVIDNHDLRPRSDFGVPDISTLFYSSNSIRYLGSVIWIGFSNSLRKICDFDSFKMTIQRWNPVDCP